MSLNIVVNLEVDWVHRWKDCPIEEVSFLKDYHRHIFKIKCVKEVSHDDRDVEIIQLKRSIVQYLEKMYYDTDKRTCFFDWKSCEMLAKELLNEFVLVSCEVLEDGENWALVAR